MQKSSFVIITLAALLSACDGSPKKGATSQATAEAAPVALGKMGTADGLEFTLTDVKTPSQVGAGGVGPKAAAGETFVVVSYMLKNTSGKPLPLMERPGVELVDAKGQTYAPDIAASLMAAGMMNDPSGMASDLNPNVSAKTKSAWLISKSAFDKGTWTLVVASDPRLTFALK